MHKKPLPRWTTLWALLGLLACVPAHAVDEHELKSAIVFNLLVFVDWPPEVLPAGSELVLCVSPTNELLAPLKALHGRPVRSQRLEVRELPPGMSHGACHASYLDTADLQRARPVGVAGLLVCDDVETPHPSATIVLRRMGGRIGFDINLEPARQARLQLSSKLLRLARKVSER